LKDVRLLPRVQRPGIHLAYAGLQMVGLLGILLSLSLLMALAYRGINVLLIAPPLALLAVLLDGETRVLAIYTQVFMAGLGGFLIRYFPLFMLGAVFGRLMNDSGSADVIARGIADRLGARHAILAIVLATAILTYGGVSLFVVAFAVYPVASALFRHANVPRRLIPGAIVLGAATFTMTALPGTPSIQNAIPMPYFGTDLYAAPGLGLIAGLVMLCFGMFWLNRRSLAARTEGEGYGQAPPEIATVARAQDLPSPGSALLPLFIVIIGNYLFTRLVIPSMETGYLTEARFGGVRLDDVRGLWSLIASLSLAILATLALHWSRLRDPKASLNHGTMSSLLPVFNTASEVGYGTVIASLAGFALIRNVTLGIAPGNPLISEALTVNVLAGITGSASGGLSIALSAMGSNFMEAGLKAGVNPELLHRVAALSSGGLDSLPHCGGIITVLAICQLTHRDSYQDIFLVSIVGPLLALSLVLALGTAFGSF